MKNRYCAVYLVIFSNVVSFSVFSNDNSSTTQTYAELQAERGLVTEAQSTLSAAEQKVKLREQQIKLYKLDNELNELKSIEARKKSKIVHAKVPTEVEQLSTQPTSPNDVVDFTKSMTEFQYNQVKQWVDELNSSIYLVDVTEIAGRREGKFWYNGSYKPMTVGDNIAGWELVSLEYNEAHFKQKALTKDVQRKTESEVLYLFQRAESLKQKVLDQRLNSAQSDMGGFNGYPGQLMTNDSPTPGLMFK